MNRSKFFATGLSAMLILGLPSVVHAETVDLERIEELHQQGESARLAKDFIETERLFREILDIDPDYSPAYSQLGYALFGQGRYHEAESSFRESIRLGYPGGEGFAYRGLGMAIGEQGRLQEAEAAYRESVRFEPDSPDTHAAVAFVILRQNQNRAPEAEGFLREAVRGAPGNIVFLETLGSSLFLQNRFSEAEAIYREVLRLNPERLDAYDLLIFSLEEQGDYIGAQEVFHLKLSKMSAPVTN